MSLSERRRSVLAGRMTKALLPLPVPWIVREGFAWTALLAVICIPAAILSGIPMEWLAKLFFGSDLEVPVWFEKIWLYGVVLPVFLSPLWAGLGAAGSRTSSFILECVQYHLEQGEVEKAEVLARVVDYQVWYREWRKNPWFRKFVAENGLLEQSARYAKFNRRKPV